eukprot:TRINITY_DN91487_c0_g1_i1.p1 TRINITY_DN91487_c0_g1~~TRINITY_DN91487_c0_g1_i1.p1  ORF type:complete len:372 (-),score=35.79 TRINITY_DN91487_c0_g1_i1:39-1154(-)
MENPEPNGQPLLEANASAGQASDPGGPPMDRTASGRLVQPAVAPLMQSIAGQLFSGEDGVVPGPNAATPSSGFEQVANASSSAVEQRQAFERNQRETVRQVLERASPQLVCLPILLFIGVVLFSMIVTVRGWFVAIEYFWATPEPDKPKIKPCDQPLVMWLLLTLCQAMITPAIQAVLTIISIFISLSEHRVKIINGMVKVMLPLVLLGVGFLWFFRSETCAQTHPDLYYFVKFYLTYQAIIIAVQYFFTCLMVSLIVYAFRNGYLDGHVEAAAPRTIELLKTVEYDPALFAPEGSGDEEKPSGSCCCCTEPFDNERPVKETPCKHYFHEACIAEWLKRAKTCPLCRLDLEEATGARGDRPPPAAAAAAEP